MKRLPTIGDRIYAERKGSTTYRKIQSCSRERFDVMTEDGERFEVLKLTWCRRQKVWLEKGNLATSFASILRQVGLAAVVLSLAFVMSARADGIPGNPDRYMSLGLDVTAAHQPQAFPGYAELSMDGTNRTIQTNCNRNDRTMTADFRVPMNSWLTLNVHGGSWRQDVGEAHSLGYTFGGGVRVYFHDSGE